MLKNSQAKLLARGKSLLASDTFHLKCSLYLVRLLLSPQKDGGVQNRPLFSFAFQASLWLYRGTMAGGVLHVGSASQGKVQRWRSSLSDKKCFGRA